MQERERRQALADFLQKRRAQLSPAEVGLPSGVRRRTVGDVFPASRDEEGIATLFRNPEPVS